MLNKIVEELNWIRQGRSLRLKERERYLKTTKEMISLLERVSLKFSSPQEINFITLSTEQYLEVGDKVYDKVVNENNTFEFNFEEDIQDKLSEFNVTEQLVIICKFEDNGRVPAHYHSVQEEIHCVKGSFVNPVDGKIYKEGDVMIANPFEIHGFETIEEGIAVIAMDRKTNKQATVSPMGTKDN